MPLAVLLAFCALIAAAGLLAAEVVRRPAAPEGVPLGPARLVTFGLASASGITLLAALAGGVWVLAAALVPLTALSILRFWMAVRIRTSALRAAAIVLVSLGVGLAVGLWSVPVPLTRAHLRGDVPPASSSPTSLQRDAGRIIRG